MTGVGDAGLAVTAVAGAFIADDVVGDAAPGMPLGTRARLAARAAVALPVVAAGWLLVLTVHQRVAEVPETVALPIHVVTALGLTSSAVAMAALAERTLVLPSPGAVGVMVMAGIGAVSRVVPEAWLEALPPGRVVSAVTVVSALAVVAVATREPR